jgi:8-oxo-dGTP diphosphatase
VAARIKHEREQRGWSTSELARRVSKAGVTLRQQQVWQIESGTPPRRLSVGEAAAFATIFGISLGTLMTPPEQSGDIMGLIKLGREFVEWRREEGALAARLFDIAARIDELSPDEVFTAVTVEKYSAVDMAGARDEVIRDLETIAENYQVVVGSIKQHGSVWSVIASMRDLVPTTAGDQQAQPVVAAIVTSSQGVLVGRRNDRTPPWGFISGEIEPGELPEDAAVREVKEETGLEVRAGQVIGERDHPATGRHMVYIAAEPTRGTEVFVGDEAELAEVRWVSPAEADELMGGQMFGPVREHLARELGEA